MQSNIFQFYGFANKDVHIETLDGKFYEGKVRLVKSNGLLIEQNGRALFISLKIIATIETLEPFFLDREDTFSKPTYYSLYHEFLKHESNID